jgi:thiol-disulfide isomerase/thioredoxin
VLEANTGDQIPAWQPIKRTKAVTRTKKQENTGTSVGGGAGGHPSAAFVKKRPPSFQVATRVLAAGVQIPSVAVNTSREIPVVDKARITRTMTMQEAPVMAEPDVVVLTKENFRSFLSSNKFAFVVFHGPDCDDCDQLTTEWEAFAQQTKKDQLAVAVGKVDCTHEKSLCDTSMTTTFPSFRWYQNARPLYGYYRNYPRTSDKFLAYAKTKIYVATTMVKAS